MRLFLDTRHEINAKNTQFLGKTTVRIESPIHLKTKVSNSITFYFIFSQTKSKLHVVLSNFYLNFIFKIIFFLRLSLDTRHEINAKNTQFFGKTSSELNHPFTKKPKFQILSIFLSFSLKQKVNFMLFGWKSVHDSPAETWL